MKILLLLAPLFFLSRPLCAGVAPLNSTVPVNGPEILIDTRPAHQDDPHVSGNIVAYTDFSGVVPATVRYYDLTTGTNVEITDTLLNRFDFLPDIHNGRLVFSRITASGQDIYLYDVGTQTSLELSPSSINRTSNRIGGDSVVWVEYQPDPVLTWRYVVAVLDLSSGTVNPLSYGPVDIYPNISPDGNVVVWLSCDVTTWEQCAVQQAIRDVNGWSTTTLVAPADNYSVATDGAIVAYTSIRNGEADIYWQPVGGGPEMQLALANLQQNPSVSDGVIVFDSFGPHSSGRVDIFAYDSITSTMYEVTANSLVNFLADVEVVSDTATVAYTTFNGMDNDVRAVSFTLNRPSSVEQQIIDLRAAISASGNHLAKALDAKLRAAEYALSNDDTSSACSSLQDFIDHVSAQRGKKISVTDADAWSSAAQQLRAAIGCP